MHTISVAAKPGRYRHAADSGPTRLCPSACGPLDQTLVQCAAADPLNALGADVKAEGLRDTPRRVAAAYAEPLIAEPFSLTTCANDERYDEPVVVCDIPFQSLCMHHVLPLYGKSHVAYLPAERLLGLSKLARMVEPFS